MIRKGFVNRLIGRLLQLGPDHPDASRLGHLAADGLAQKDAAQRGGAKDDIYNGYRLGDRHGG